tara:strand:+ start:85630 stop:86625 length:996 start_codon:yes stop_codon:yes gene_type:complete
MNLRERIEFVIKIVEEFGKLDDELLRLAHKNNSWFDEKSVLFSLNHWRSILNSGSLNKWLNNYDQSKFFKHKKILVLNAGNIPLAGFHDFLCVFLTGNSPIIKMSSNDSVLFPKLISRISSSINKFPIKLINSVEDVLCDKLIMSGNNISTQIVEYKFKNTSKLIRRNKNSIAIINGEETDNEIENLGDDIFTYYGMGCRNVSKLYIKKGFSLNRLIKIFTKKFSYVSKNVTYMNNYNYYKAICQLDGLKFSDGLFFIFKEDESIGSPISVINYEFYDNLEEIYFSIEQRSDDIQCIVSSNHIAFGNSQKPKISDYPDGIDTISFITDQLY